MKVLWLFPPSPIEGYYPNISQYRFFKYMAEKTSIIYPYLAASGVTQLRDNNFDVTFMDCPTEEKTWDNVKEAIAKTDILVLEARTPLINYIWDVAVKANIIKSELTTILYGDHVTAFPQESLNQKCVDYVVRGGDFDVGVTHLCLALRALATVPRSYSQTLVQDLDTLSWVNREFVNWRSYFEAWRHRDNFFWTMSGRGCWYDCTFCAWTRPFWENKVRLRSPEDVSQEYCYLYDEYGECEILDDIDLFVTSWGVKFSDELLCKGFDDEKIIWAYQTHPNEIRDLQDFKLMHKAGLRTVKIGIESMNQSTLDRIRKKTTVKQIEHAIKTLKEAKVMVHANMMVGYPWETKEDAYSTIKLIKKLDPNQAQFSMLIPYPWTDMFKEAVENGKLNINPSDYSEFAARKPMLKMEGMTPQEVSELYRDCWRKFYLDWKYVLRKLAHVEPWHLENMRQLIRGYRSVKKGHMRAMEDDRTK